MRVRSFSFPNYDIRARKKWFGIELLISWLDEFENHLRWLEGVGNNFARRFLRKENKHHRFPFPYRQGVSIWERTWEETGNCTGWVEQVRQVHIWNIFEIEGLCVFEVRKIMNLVAKIILENVSKSRHCLYVKNVTETSIL